MKRLWILIKTQLMNLFFQNNSGKKRKIPSALISCIVMFALSLYYSWIFSDTLADGAMLPVMVSVLGTVIVFMSGISVSQGMLFGFKDYDLLMSLPVSEREIVSSKIVVYVLSQYVYSMLLVIPAMVIHGVRLSADFMYFVRAVIGCLFLPLVPMVLAAVAGLLMQRLVAGRRYGRLMQNVMTILFVAVIYYFSFNMGMSSADPAGGSESLISAMGRYLPTAGWYMEGVVNGEVKLLLLLAASGLIALAAFIFLYSRSVIRINAKAAQGYHVKDFRMRRTSRTSSLNALIRQEQQRYFGNFMYFLNTSMGMIVLAIFSVYIIFLKNPIKEALIEVLQQDPQRTAMVWQTLLLAIAIPAQMTCTTGVSISLEGKSLWIMKSIPVDTGEIFSSKIIINTLLILVPSLLSVLGFGIALHLPPLYYLCGLILIVLCALFISMLGLLINLRFPKLDFDREAVVIKQSLSSFLSIMVPLFFAIGVFVFFIVTEMAYFYWIVGLYLVLDIILFVLLQTYGRERFRKLA